MDVCLVKLSFAHLTPPSIDLGLLQATLRDQPLTSTTVYANFEFAESLGLSTYVGVCDTLIEAMVGEWVFAPAAVPQLDTDERDYVRFLRDRTSWLQQFGEDELLDGLLDIRRLAKSFIRRLASRLLDDRPKIVGCTSMFRQHTASLALLREVRELAPEVITMLGGANCETFIGKVVMDTTR